MHETRYFLFTFPHAVSLAGLFQQRQPLQSLPLPALRAGGQPEREVLTKLRLGHVRAQAPDRLVRPRVKSLDDVQVGFLIPSESPMTEPTSM